MDETNYGPDEGKGVSSHGVNSPDEVNGSAREPSLTRARAHAAGVPSYDECQRSWEVA